MSDQQTVDALFHVLRLVEEYLSGRAASAMKGQIRDDETAHLLGLVRDVLQKSISLSNLGDRVTRLEQMTDKLERWLGEFRLIRDKQQGSDN